MTDVRDLAPYQAVIAGSTTPALAGGARVRGGKWLPEAMQFMRTHRAILAQKPFAAFLVCITLAMPNAYNYRAGVATWLEPVRRLVKPVSEGLFAGALDMSRVPLAFDTLTMHIVSALGFFPKGDHRDWSAIREWAESLRPLLAR